MPKVSVEKHITSITGNSTGIVIRVKCLCPRFQLRTGSSACVTHRVGHESEVSRTGPHDTGGRRVQTLKEKGQSLFCQFTFYSRQKLELLD